MKGILHHALGDGFTQADIDRAMKHLTQAEVDEFLDLALLAKADYLVDRIKQPVIRKEKIAGEWRDVAGPMLFLRGLYGDDGSHEILTMTENYQWMAQGLPPKAPFPYWPYPEDELRRHGVHEDQIGWDYLDWVMFFLLDDLKRAMAVGAETPELLLPKCREMVTSWLVVGYIFWQCEFQGTTGWIAQSEKDEKAKGLIKYANILYENQPDYLKARFPLKAARDTGTQHRLDWDHSSWFRAVAQGERQLASDHPFGYFNDESAHQPAWNATVNIVKPAVRQIICVSSAAFSDFGLQCDPSLAVGDDERLRSSVLGNVERPARHDMDDKQGPAHRAG